METEYTEDRDTRDIPFPSRMFSSVKSITDLEINEWLTSIARRPLSKSELKTVEINRFSGAEGLSVLSRDHGKSHSRIPAEHDSYVWRSHLGNIEIAATLSTPLEHEHVQTIDGNKSMTIFSVITGPIEITTTSQRRVHPPGAVFLVPANESYLLKAENTFSLFIVRVTHRTSVISSFPYEPSRLFAAVELARTILVGQLLQHHWVTHDRHILSELLLHVLRGNPDDIEEGKPTDVRYQVRKLVEIAHTDPNFNVQAIAQQLNISRTHLYRHFTGLPESLNDIIANRRLKTALTLMSDHPDLSIAEIARNAGFGSTENFRRVFTSRMGCGPREYRRAHLPLSKTIPNAVNHTTERTYVSTTKSVNTTL